jgi:hypothetical protein
MKVARVLIVPYVRRDGPIGLLRVSQSAVDRHRHGLRHSGPVAKLAVRVLAPTFELPARDQRARVFLPNVDG